MRRAPAGHSGGDFFESGTIPDIIYGQVLSNIAHGGAEAQSYQLVSEMLERGVEMNEMTVNFLMLSLAKNAAYAVLFKIRDLLVRYGVQIPPIALNAVLNACDKAGAYGEALSFYFFKMQSTDYLGVSCLLKACDRLGSVESAKWATIIVMQAQRQKSINLSVDIYERLFALYLKTQTINLALGFLLHIEEIRQGDITFLGVKVKAEETNPVCFLLRYKYAFT